ncbi:MAG: hypothetical protein JNM77_08760 [Pseudonocardia sp.]|nr:hypothetical protein [Pseudonocardia sp.]
MATGVIKVEGLAEFNRSLRRLDRNAPKALRLAGNVAAGIVVKEAKPRVPLGPGKGGHARSSLKAASTRTAARVSAGGNKFPYYGWLDFGSKKKYPRLPVRPFRKRGRYIWAAFGDRREDVQETLREELVAAAESAGLGVS